MTFTECHSTKKECRRMDQQKIEMFLMSNREYFPEDKIVFIKDKLKTIDDEKFLLISSVELKNPLTMLLMSLFLGSLGVDRFMLGDTGMGVLKLLTGGLCGILTIIDWFSVSKKAKEKNFNTIMTLL